MILEAQSAGASGHPDAVAPRSDLSGVASPPESLRRRADALRTVTYLMLFRAALATVLMASVVALALVQGTPEDLGGPFVRFVFLLLAVTYLATLGYAMAVRRVQDPVQFAYLQIAVDLAVATILVHATGGAQSGFTFLYLVDVIAVTLLSQRRGAAYVATASCLLLAAVSIGGYLQMIPPVPGQRVFPWEMSQRDLVFRIVLNVAALGAVGALTTTLARQTRQVGERLTRHEEYAGDLATLHENTIRCLSSGLVTTSLDGRITSINDAACDILAIPTGQFFGDSLGTRIPGLAAVLDEAGADGSLRRVELEAIRPDGAIRHLGISAGPLSDHAGRVIGRIIHFQDLTELHQMQERVERSERLATIGRLAAGIAHEIRNPLASISGSMEILKQVSSADADSQQLMEIAVREVDRLNRLITDFLEYARPRGEERLALDLGEHAAEIVKAFEQERRPRDVAVSLAADENVCIEADVGQIRQVLWNLVRNAEQAIPTGGGRIAITARKEARAGKAEAVLRVSDTGTGIADADRGRIFEPFFSTKPGGTGLGLATVARIVENHRGTVDFETEIGQGTTFTVRFPLFDPARSSGSLPAIAEAGGAPRSSAPGPAGPGAMRSAPATGSLQAKSSLKAKPEAS